MRRISILAQQAEACTLQIRLLIGNIWASVGDHTGAYKTILLFAHVSAVTLRYCIGIFLLLKTDKDKRLIPKQKLCNLRYVEWGKTTSLHLMCRFA